jgi:hypothetical protein
MLSYPVSVRNIKHKADYSLVSSINYLTNKLVDLVSRYSNGLWAGRPGFDSLQRKDFSLLQSAQAGSGAHPAFYSMDNKGYLPGSKAAVQGVKTNFHLFPRSRMVKPYLHLPHMYSWRSV